MLRSYGYPSIFSQACADAARNHVSCHGFRAVRNALHHTRPQQAGRYSHSASRTCTDRSRRSVGLPTRTGPVTWTGVREQHDKRSASTEPIGSSSVKDHVRPYQRPETGLLALLPTSWLPFAELARLDKPAGSIYLFFPCLFSACMVSTYVAASPSTLVSTIGLFGLGAVVMRGAGCTINDLWDRDLDPMVSRTRLRPLARKAVRPGSALMFAGAQCLVGLAVLLQLPQPACFYWGAPSLLLVALYPLAKRVTHYPQVVLGLTFSWGALMGFPALGVDLAFDKVAAQAAACLYASCVSWTVLYDMIYAHMDAKDDRVAGIKSIALKHEKNTKTVLSGLAMGQIALLSASGYLLGLGPAFFAISCGGSLGTLALMIGRVRLQEPDDCWWWFKNGAWLTGGTISAGLLIDYSLYRTSPADEVN